MALSINLSATELPAPGGNVVVTLEGGTPGAPTALVQLAVIRNKWLVIGHGSFNSVGTFVCDVNLNTTATIFGTDNRTGNETERLTVRVALQEV